MIVKFALLIFCFILSEIHALNCRTEGSLKNDELKKIYNNCLKQHGDNDSNNSENDWHRLSRDPNSDRDVSDEERSGKNERQDAKNWMGGRTDKKVKHDNNDQYNDYEKSYNQNEGQNSRNRMYNNHRMDEKNNNKDNYYQQNDNYGQEAFYPNEYETAAQSPNMYSSPNYRYKRERSEKNSGQRSQYNPNTRRSHVDNHRDNRNSNDSSKDNGKACAMHCFLHNLHMTGDNGMPDRYLMTNVMSKDVRNEDLRDFLQESIEECFQILDNENTDNKCEFSRNVLICLSEKGRSTCDDWKDDVQFM